jgi:integrase/recombinase XerD
MRGAAMLVQRVVAPVSGAVSWTVVDECFDPVAPAEAYLAHLEAIERSPNTVRAYASSLRLWFEYLAGQGVAWDAVGLDDVGRFVSWLRSPAEGVIVIDAGAARRAVATVNRHLAAVFGLYDFHARSGFGSQPS